MADVACKWLDVAETPFAGRLVSMKTHRTIILKTTLPTADEFENRLRRMIREMPHWNILDAESASYAESTGRPSFLIGFRGDDALPAAAVALTKSEHKQLRFESPNIVPRESSQLSLTQYNAIAARFTTDIQSCSSYKKSRIKAEITNESVRLDELVPSARCRRLLKAYLEGYALTRHPADIRRLDHFTVAAFRGGSRVSPDDIAEYLVEDQNWTTADANWVRDRMRTGLEILAASRDF